MAFTIDKPSPLPALCPLATDRLCRTDRTRGQMLGRHARTGIADGHDDRPVFERRVSATRRLSVCDAARSPQDSGAPARAASDRRRRFPRPGRCGSTSPRLFCGGPAWRASTRPNTSSSGTSCTSNDSPPPSRRDKSSRSPTMCSTRCVSSRMIARYRSRVSGSSELRVQR